MCDAYWWGQMGRIFSIIHRNVFFLSLEIGSYSVSQADLELTILQLGLWNAEIIGMCHNTWHRISSSLPPSISPFLPFFPVSSSPSWPWTHLEGQPMFLFSENSWFSVSQVLRLQMCTATPVGKADIWVVYQLSMWKIVLLISNGFFFILLSSQFLWAASSFCALEAWVTLAPQ